MASFFFFTAKLVLAQPDSGTVRLFWRKCTNACVTDGRSLISQTTSLDLCSTLNIRIAYDPSISTVNAGFDDALCCQVNLTVCAKWQDCSLSKLPAVPHAAGCLPTAQLPLI